MGIKLRRIKAGYLQKEVAKELGVSVQAVYNWEHNIDTPRLNKLRAMAKLFGCTIDELLSED